MGSDTATCWGASQLVAGRKSPPPKTLNTRCEFQRTVRSTVSFLHPKRREWGDPPFRVRCPHRRPTGWATAAPPSLPCGSSNPCSGPGSPTRPGQDLLWRGGGCQLGPERRREPVRSLFLHSLGTLHRFSNIRGPKGEGGEGCDQRPWARVLLVHSGAHPAASQPHRATNDQRRRLCPGCVQ